MNKELIGLLFTFGLGFFILIGSMIVFFIKNNNHLIKFSIGMAFGVLLMISLHDLLPEIIHIFSEEFNFLIAIVILILITCLGIYLLKLLDKFIPHHGHHHDHKEEIDENSLYHMGVISSIALVLHNIIEGMAVYSALKSDIHTGILLSIGIGLHNIPLGMIIAIAFYKKNQSKLKTLFISFLISCSTFFGGLIIYFISSKINDLFLGTLLSVTFGMIIYIMFFELLPHITCEKERRTSIFGIILGIIMILISMLFHHH